MGLNNVILVAEDRLTDAVSTKILEHFGIEIVKRVIYEGNSYLQRKAPSYNQAAYQECGVFMLTDLDSPIIQFVREHWNLERAATTSPSLKRTLDRLAQGKNMRTDQ